VLHIRTEAADAGNDGLAVSGMLADLARQREQPKRAVEIDVVRIDPLRQAGPFRLFTVDPFAELQVRPETAGTQRNVEPARRILAELLHAAVGSAVRTVPGHELARIAAFRIVAAADKAAELAELERETPSLAARAFARIDTIRAWRKKVRRQHLVERVDDLGDPQLLDIADGGGEFAPEIPQQVAPRHLVVGDAIELLF